MYPRVKCHKSCLNLPKKLVSSMYLLGALKALTERTNIGSFRTYGLFIMRTQFSIGVELEVSITADPKINILWTQDEILYLVNKIK